MSTWQGGADGPPPLPLLRGAEVKAASYDALQRLAAFREDQTVKWASAAEIGASPAILGGLVRRGFARSSIQTERVRGERTDVYRLFQITERGLHYVPLPDNRRFGYEHATFMQDLHERLCAARGLDPALFHSDVYFDASWAYTEIARRKPNLRERQQIARAQRPEPPPRPDNRLTEEEIAYLSELLGRQNDPLAASIAGKVCHG